MLQLKHRSRRSCCTRPQRWLEPSLTPTSAISPMHRKFKADLVLWNKANYTVFKRRETCALDCKYEKEKRTWLKNPFRATNYVQNNVHYTQHYLKTVHQDKAFWIKTHLCTANKLYKVIIVQNKEFSMERQQYGKVTPTYLKLHS